MRGTYLVFGGMRLICYLVQGARLRENQALLVKRRARQVHLQLILQVAA